MFGKKETHQENINNLRPVGHVNPDKVEHFKNGGAGADEPVEYFVGEDGEKYIADGTHRFFGKLAKGEETIDAYESDRPEEVKRGWFRRAFDGSK